MEVPVTISRTPMTWIIDEKCMDFTDRFYPMRSVPSGMGTVG